MIRIRDVVIASALCLAGLTYSVAYGPAWSIFVTSACVVVVIGIFVISHHRWARR